MPNQPNLSVGIVIPTLNAQNDLEKNLKVIDQKQNIVLVVDSNSSDKTLEIAKKYKCKISIENNFNHGLTRERARKILNTDIVVFLTQDAYIESQESINRLVKPIKDGKASIAYGRQIPRKNSSIFESFPIHFNYPNLSNIRSIESVKENGVYTFFCSDNFGAYLNKDLDEIGGFEYILTGEDYVACTHLLLNGKKVAYVSEATAEHSHSFSLLKNFRRYFDTGLIRGERPYIQELVGHANSRGAKLTKLFFKKILNEKPHLIFYAFFETVFKYLGFKIGFQVGFYGTKLPSQFKKLFSNQKYFWN
tara:strand:+ start:3551 stop:4468 length:918 start_codon:yes stop_codon:yes gene_type:complete